jgi:hypothetical protein
MLGTMLPNPVTDSWPNSASSLGQIDMDGDGKPGVTLLCSGSRDNADLAARLGSLGRGRPTRTPLPSDYRGAVSIWRARMGGTTIARCLVRAIICADFEPE